MKNLIIGASHGYTWNQLKYWVNSIRKNVPNTDIALVLYSADAETVNKCRENVDYLFGNILEDGSAHDDMRHLPIVHVLRFFTIKGCLDLIKTEKKHGRVITTDVRDVIFQSDPFAIVSDELFYCGTEGLMYKDEPWGKQNYHDSYGFDSFIANKEICNVGVLGASSLQFLSDICFQIYVNSINRPIQICDQATFNHMVNLDPYRTLIKKYTPEDSLVAHLGTLLDPKKEFMFDSKLLWNKPKFYNGKFINHHNVEYAIVHQYDRTQYRKQIEEQYE